MKRLGVVWLSLLLIMLPLWAQEVRKVEKAKSLDEIQKKYPGAKLKMMTLEEYGLMKALYDETGRPYPGSKKPEPEKTEAADADSTIASQEDNASEEDNTSMPSQQTQKEPSHIHTNISAQHVQLDLPHVDSSGDGAMVVLVVIGIVVVAILVVYAAKYLYDVATSGKKYEYWMDAGWTYTYFSSKQNYNAGSMSGVKFSTGFKDGRAKIGVSAEAGAFEFTLQGVEESSWVNFGGSYAMAGPHVRFASGENAYIYLELLGGRSSHESVDTLAIGRFGIHALMGHVTAGVNIGAIYMGLADSEGIVQDVDNYETTTGFEIGYSF